MQNINLFEPSWHRVAMNRNIYALTHSSSLPIHFSTALRPEWSQSFDNDYYDPILMNEQPVPGLNFNPDVRKYSSESLQQQQQLAYSDTKSCFSDPPGRSSASAGVSKASAGGRVTSPMTREDVMNLRGRQKFRVKDWEMARFLAKVNKTDFQVQASERNSNTPGKSASSSRASQGAGIRGVDGILMVHIIAGTGLHSSHAILRDLYCVVETDSVRKARSMIRTSTECFEWDEVFELDVEDSRCLSFLLYQWDPRSRHRLCFYGNLNLTSLIDSFKRSYAKQPTEKIALKLEPKGLLYMELGFISMVEAFRRLRATHPNCVFGSSLDTVIKRERTGWRVPAVIKRCVEEVDRRGLDIVGVYRLSGSAKLKAYIRDMFERGPLDADLSPERVPDLHAVTAVLKDYLRELPEPLFTNALYRMVLDAIQITLPGDSSSGAKLMLNILDCLPPNNQDTLLYLLDHLKRVINRADTNKMNSQNLAASFGPVLLHPSPEAAKELDRRLLEPRKMTEILKYILEIWPVAQDPPHSMVESSLMALSSTNLRRTRSKTNLRGGHSSVRQQQEDSTPPTPRNSRGPSSVPGQQGGDLTSGGGGGHLGRRSNSLEPQNRYADTRERERERVGPSNPSVRHNSSRSNSQERRNYYQP